MPFHEEIESLVKRNKLPSFVADILNSFYKSYVDAVAIGSISQEQVDPLLMQLTHLCVKQITHPYRFEPYHKRITSPFNYYAFGNDFIRPLIDRKRSRVLGENHLVEMENAVRRGENVILLANHQIEPDPQVISILLEERYPMIAEEMIFVAGHRVVTDPLAVPFSLGRNLLCIYSKKHIDTPPEQKAEKLMHNQRTLKKLLQLLSEGGKCIYVAPSGGRDRPDSKGYLFPEEFDPQSIELFALLAKQAKTPTHFYPLALATYALLPPPNTVEKEIGEKRHASLAPAHLNFGEEVNLETLVHETEDKQEKRVQRAKKLTDIVRRLYAEIDGSTPVRS